MELVDAYVLFRALRKRGGAPMGGCEEQATGAREGSLVLEFGGMARSHEKEPDELSVMTKHSNREAGGVEEARGAISSCRGGEEIVEGEPGGETEASGGHKPILMCMHLLVLCNDLVNRVQSVFVNST
jgi:hypothetical protein